ncbi:hypothetical protein NDU88_000978 [Pleurodeles waltl]|uniref:Uncharacterized protein n=1 Tax=Pleurodeles waltl TaxID=8319 RepID=A0AAV7S622_PLEWA|nr:hypothetical protein NDU88_000978 [Pleurodeles waltl]
MRGLFVSLTNREHKQLLQEFHTEEEELAGLQSLDLTDPEIQQDELRAQRSVAEKGDMLDAYTLTQHRQCLHRAGDKLSRLLAWLFRRESALPSVIHLIESDGVTATLRVDMVAAFHLHQGWYRGLARSSVDQIRGFLTPLEGPQLGAVAELDAEVTLEELRRLCHCHCYLRTRPRGAVS